MRLGGATLKAIDVAMTDFLSRLKRRPSTRFVIRVESFDIDVTENRHDWQIDFTPNEQIRREINQQNPGLLISLNDYCLDYIVRKADFKIVKRIGSQ
jgi:hypothetical protein